MPYIGNPIYQSAFVTDQFSGDGSTTAFTMSVAPAGVTNVLVAVSGVLQDPSTYGVSGLTLTFSAAPPSGTGNISCRYLGIPVTGVVTTAYRTVTEFTATASQTTFTPPSYTVGYINVYRNGTLLGSADYTATNGTTVVLATGATAGDLVTVESFRVESVLNAIPNAAGAVSATNLAGGAALSNIGAGGITSTYLASGSVSPANLSTGGIYWDTSSNVGVGTTSPKAKTDIYGSGSTSQRLSTDTSEFNYHHKASKSVSVTSWATMFTITPSANSSNWMRGSVKVTAAGHTSGVANGLLQDAVYYIDMDTSTMTAGSVSAGTSSGSGAPQFRVTVSGTTWLVQLQSSNGSNSFDGVATFEFNIPKTAGNVRTFTIS